MIIYLVYRSVYIFHLNWIVHSCYNAYAIWNYISMEGKWRVPERSVFPIGPCHNGVYANGFKLREEKGHYIEK